MVITQQNNSVVASWHFDWQIKFRGKEALKISTLHINTFGKDESLQALFLAKNISVSLHR